mmetsp:Transcript_92595/g.277841  ORF Transcript_92595/g.277841 Transcript_92595/m.277841 type:complete len:538 (+) Transcript_92595:476-2089(+)
MRQDARAGDERDSAHHRVRCRDGAALWRVCADGPSQLYRIVRHVPRERGARGGGHRRLRRRDGSRAVDAVGCPRCRVGAAVGRGHRAGGPPRRRQRDQRFLLLPALVDPIRRRAFALARRPAVKRLPRSHFLGLRDVDAAAAAHTPPDDRRVAARVSHAAHRRGAAQGQILHAAVRRHHVPVGECADGHRDVPLVGVHRPPRAAHLRRHLVRRPAGLRRDCELELAGDQGLPALRGHRRLLGEQGGQRHGARRRGTHSPRDPAGRVCDRRRLGLHQLRRQDRARLCDARREGRWARPDARMGECVVGHPGPLRRAAAVPPRVPQLHLWPKDQAGGRRAALVPAHGANERRRPRQRLGCLRAGHRLQRARDDVGHARHRPPREWQREQGGGALQPLVCQRAAAICSVDGDADGRHHQFSDRRGWLPSDGAVRLPRAPDPRECASFAAEADRGHDRDARARRSVPWQHVRALVRRHHTATDASCPAARGVCALRGRRGRAQKPAMRAQGGRRGAVGARSGPRPVGVVRVSWTVSGWRGR